MLAALTPMDDARALRRASLTGLEPRKKDVIPEILPPETGTTRVVRTVLVADVVESVRLMQEDEAGTVQRWRAFVDHVVHQLLPGQEGRLVKSLGDGLMLEFPRVNTAIGIAFAMQEAAAHANVDVAPERKLHLRIGIHVSPLVADEHDIYGHGVNLAARLTTLAGPDEIVVSADVRDQLTPALDADIEDLGECYVKHVQQPVRAFRVGAPGEQPVIERGNLAEDLRATIAVIPFRPRALQPTDDVLGQLLADEVISALSRSPEVNVVSRLSTTAFQGREVKLDDVSAYLRADYVVSGSYHVDGDRVTLKAEMAETRTMQVVWTQTLKGSVNGVIAGDDPLAGQLVSEACAAMMVRELQRSQGKAPQSLQNHTLLLSSIALMHRISPLAFQRAQQLLQVLIERTPRLASPYAWMAKWHVLRVTQGWSPDAHADGQGRARKHQARTRPRCHSVARHDGRRPGQYLHPEAARCCRAALCASTAVEPERFARVAAERHAARVPRRGQGSGSAHAARIEAVSARSAEVLLRLVGGHRRALGAPVSAGDVSGGALFPFESNAHIDLACADYRTLSP